MKKFAVFVAIISALAAVVSSRDVKCDSLVYDPKSGNTYYYDLSILHHDDKTYTDPLWYRSSKNNIYFVNFCGQTASACDSDDTSVCIRLPDGEDYKYVSGGRTSTQTMTVAETGLSPENAVTVTYFNGSQCGAGSFKTKFYVKCQPDAVPGYIYDLDDSNECEPILYLYSKAGCGELYQSSSHSESSSMPPLPTQCGAILTQGSEKYLFDLSVLHHNSSYYIDTIWYRTDKNIIYYVNFCGQTAAACEEDDTSVCIRAPNGYDYDYFSGGSTSTQSIYATQGARFGKSVTVTYSDGAKCGLGKMRTNFVINCIETATPGYIYDIDIISDCEATLYLYSSAGCGEKM